MDLVKCKVINDQLGAKRRDCSNLNSAISILSTVSQQLIDASFEGAIIKTGWHGDEINDFLDEARATVPSTFNLVIDELFSQPYLAVPRNISFCDRVFPIPALDAVDPQGPPLASQVPPAPICAADFTNTQPGAQPAPDCVCLANNTNYPVTFFPFLDNITSPEEVPENVRIVVPPLRLATYSKAGSDSFFSRAIEGRDGSFSLGVVWDQWPASQRGGINPGSESPGDPVVQSSAPGERITSLKCVGVSDAKNGVASANAGFECPQVFFQFDDGNFNPPPTFDGQGCTTLSWTARGDGYNKITGFQIKTLEAPPPDPLMPDATIVTYEQAPIIIIPMEELVVEDSEKTVSGSYRFCANAGLPEGLSGGTYQFRVQPLAGIPSVAAIDLETSTWVVPSGSTRWNTLGKFTIDFPTGSGLASVGFSIPGGRSFTFTRPEDNATSNFTLPGRTPDSTDPPLITTMTLTFDDGRDKCMVGLIITAGMDEGSQDGQAALTNAPVDSGSPEACYLELQDDRTTVNGSSFQFSGL